MAEILGLFLSIELALMGFCKVLEQDMWGVGGARMQSEELSSHGEWDDGAFHPKVTQMPAILSRRCA